jgi:O-methyltransferase
MNIRRAIKLVLRRISAPLLAQKDVRKWPRIAARIHDLSLPAAVIPHPAPSPSGAANINIILDLLDEVAEIPGTVAECGVYRGQTLIPLSVHLRSMGSSKRIFGFDSFEGFPTEDLKAELKLGRHAGNANESEAGDFKDTSFALVRQKLALFGLKNVTLSVGYFSNTLARCADEVFSFVHLDCDLYGSYKDCLEFFYPRLSKGGIVLIDEYHDPPWPGCNKAVDEFLADKQERLQLIERQNYQKYFFRKEGARLTSSQSELGNRSGRLAGDFQK